MVEIFLFPVRIRGGSRLHQAQDVLQQRGARSRDAAAAETAGSAGSIQARALSGNHNTRSRRAAVCSAQPALLTLSYGSSEKELAPRSSPSWPGAPGCHGSEKERNIKGRHGTDSSRSTSQLWVSSHSEPLAGQHHSCLYKTAGMEGTLPAPAAPGCTGEQPTSPFLSCEVPQSTHFLPETG